MFIINNNLLVIGVINVNLLSISDLLDLLWELRLKILCPVSIVI